MEFNDLGELVKYVQGKECLVVRSLEDGGKHWIENYENLKEGEEPKIIPITEDLFLDCFDTDYFIQDETISTKEIFYFEFNPLYYQNYRDNPREE